MTTLIGYLSPEGKQYLAADTLFSSPGLHEMYASKLVKLLLGEEAMLWGFIDDLACIQRLIDALQQQCIKKKYHKTIEELFKAQRQGDAAQIRVCMYAVWEWMEKLQNGKKLEVEMLVVGKTHSVTVDQFGAVMVYGPQEIVSLGAGGDIAEGFVSGWQAAGKSISKDALCMAVEESMIIHGCGGDIEYLTHPREEEDKPEEENP